MEIRDATVMTPGKRKLALAAIAGLLFVLVSACGAGGPSVPACRTDAETEPPPPSPEASLTLTVGSYEGTGSAQCIRELGFQPVLVIIKGDTGEFAVWRSSSMEGDSTADFASGKPNFEDGVTSLDPDAFSLGEDATVNAEGFTYYYVAFADSPDIKVGSYAGDGTDGRSVSDVGFQPALVFLKWDGARSAVWSSVAHEEGVASFFSGGEDPTNLIQALEADGFQVSADPFVNAADGLSYHYVAFRENQGLSVGTYIGDGSSNRQVTGIGFRPDYVWIKGPSDDGGAVHRPGSLEGDASLRFKAVPNGTDEIKALQPDGFRIGSEPTVNSDGDTYYYVAWKSSSGP